jgi:hypothetical protein
MHSSIVSLPLPSAPRHASLTGRAATFIVCRPARGSPGPSRAQRLLPGPGHLRHYQRSWLRGDVITGVTVAAYLVPQVMAYAEVAGPAGAIRYLRAITMDLYSHVMKNRSQRTDVQPTAYIQDQRGADLQRWRVPP